MARPRKWRQVWNDAHMDGTATFLDMERFFETLYRWQEGFEITRDDMAAGANALTNHFDSWRVEVEQEFRLVKATVQAVSEDRARSVALWARWWQVVWRDDWADFVEFRDIAASWCDRLGVEQSPFLSEFDTAMAEEQPKQLKRIATFLAYMAAFHVLPVDLNAFRLNEWVREETFRGIPGLEDWLIDGVPGQEMLARLSDFRAALQKTKEGTERTLASSS